MNKKKIEIIEQREVLNNRIFYEKYKSHFAVELLLRESQYFVKNVKTKFFLLRCEDDLIPCTLNETDYDNAVICSPYTTFVSYAKSEFKNLSGAIPLFFQIIINVFGLIAKLFKFNQVIQLNNPLALSLEHPRCLAENLSEITKTLILKYPNYAIYIPRFINIDNLYSQLQLNNYQCMPTMVAYLLDPKNIIKNNSKGRYSAKRHAKNDTKLLNTSGYKSVSFTDLTKKQIQRVRSLYKMLYLGRHSKYNPNYTEEYFKQLIHENDHLFLYLAKESGTIDAFACLRIKDKLISCTPVGYDTRLPQNLNLYRQLTALTLKEAKTKNHVL
ncbi:hypothetical protein, partial [Coxiella burnetii]|uniref:hypothetical protein n=1 Tax=Coxiella burnetii TaxID=777 RepID=UPI00217678B3